MRAQEQQEPFLLRSMRDSEGFQFYCENVAPLWLVDAWQCLMGCADEAEKRIQQDVKTALGGKCSLMGTGFTQVTVAIDNPTPLHADGNNIGLSVLCAFD
eukprot:5398225-Pleurochrysis_carterae.AAC.1